MCNMLEETFLKLTTYDVGDHSGEDHHLFRMDGDPVYKGCKELLLCCSWLCIEFLKVWNRSLFTALRKLS